MSEQEYATAAQLIEWLETQDPDEPISVELTTNNRSEVSKDEDFKLKAELGWDELPKLLDTIEQLKKERDYYLDELDRIVDMGSDRSFEEKCAMAECMQFIAGDAVDGVGLNDE